MTIFQNAFQSDHNSDGSGEEKIIFVSPLLNTGCQFFQLVKVATCSNTFALLVLFIKTVLETFTLDGINNDNNVITINKPIAPAKNAFTKRMFTPI